MIRSILFLVLTCLSLQSASLYELDQISEGLFTRECGGKKNKLVYWSPFEDNPSLGIGHFIWQASGTSDAPDPFTQLIFYLRARGLFAPPWLDMQKGCPWKSREDMIKDSERVSQLESFLWRTRLYQACFAKEQLEYGLREIQKHYPELEVLINRLQLCHSCYLAMIDYINLKSTGLTIHGTAQTSGCGLVHVLLQMDQSRDDLLAEFVQSAKVVITNHVRHSKDPSKRRFLQGWLNRMDSYLEQRTSLQSRIGT